MILRRSTVLLTSLLSLTCAIPVLAAPVAKVNDVTISDQEVDQILKNNPALAQNPQGRPFVINTLISNELLHQKAKAQRLDSDGEVKTAIDAATRQILINAATARYLRDNPVSDAAVRQRYDQLVKNMPKEEYRIRHIMVKSQDEANDLLRRLQRSKKSFAALAAQSLDAGTAGKGGELGWIAPNFLLPEIAAEVLKLKPGQIGGPIQTPQGWDIIEVMDKRKAKAPSLDQVKEQVRAQLQQEALQQYLVDLRNQAKVTVLDPSIAASPATAPARQPDRPAAAPARQPDRPAAAPAQRPSSRSPFGWDR